MRDWKTLFMAGRPLYEENLEASRRSAELDIMSSSLTRSTQLDTTTDDQLLNDIDFQEYKVRKKKIEEAKRLQLFFSLLGWCG